MHNHTNLKINDLEKLTHQKSTEDTLKLLFEHFNGKLAFSNSFGLEDQVIMQLIHQSGVPARVFTLDTGRLFQETYQVFSRTLERYKINIEVYFPETRALEKLTTEKGPNSFYYSVENRKECCHIRKVEPLKRALSGVQCWITGLRAGQSEARKKILKFEWDTNFQMVKFNPLYDWTLEQVQDFVKKNNTPYNPLHDKGFVSIGCAPCTRAIEIGEDFRAGRWWWETGSQKECGLHVKT